MSGVAKSIISVSLALSISVGAQTFNSLAAFADSKASANVTTPKASTNIKANTNTNTNRKISAATRSQLDKKPNILVIMGDDIGWFNINAYNHGLMGYDTPNINRLAKEGMMFTDAYGEQSCTAGRAAFITGQHPFRTGLLKIGLPGDKHGLSSDDPTLAELLEPLGYISGQFGKNHLGDRNEYLPTNHGFDEFFGNLYHLNAEQEPENPDYPKDPSFRQKYGPRGVLKATKGGEIIDTGSLNTKRMETVDQEFLDATLDFIDRANKSGKPWFTWFNSTRMHIFTHLKESSKGKTGLGIYPDGMVEHDGHVGVLLKKLDDLGIADNTIVIYLTDNGAECFSWPDGGTTPFKGEKDTNWEGGFRIPMIIRYPNKIKAGQVSNEIISNQDLLPTLLAVAGESDIKQKLLQGYQVGNKTFKVHLDGYNFLPYLEGQAKHGPRSEFYYFNDDGELVGLRFKEWKLNFAEQRAKGLEVWQEPFVKLRAPSITNLRTDPFERAKEEAADYKHWYVNHMFMLIPAKDYVGTFISTFKDYPCRQKSTSMNLEQVMERMSGQHAK